MNALIKARIRVMFVLFVAISFSVPAFAQQSPQPVETVTINEYELAYIFNGQLGGGKLNFQGNTYDFKLGGLGIGGIGASHITATGDVYNLKNVWQFPGTFVQASLGYGRSNPDGRLLCRRHWNGLDLSWHR